MFLACQDVAILEAARADQLRLEERFSDRLNEPYFALVDAAGVIEVHLTADEAEIRVADVLTRAAAVRAALCQGAPR